MRSAEDLAALMAGYAFSPNEQIAQSELRIRLVRTWGIEPGMRVLEVGCGQGDMTAALAEAVGPGGRVHAIDLGPDDYGAPVSLGDSARHLLAGPLGERIDFSFSCDVLTHAFEGQYDVVVLALCSWYFESLVQVQEVLARLSQLAPTLCFAEWDMRPREFSQVAHFLAVLIQGQISFQWPGNVRTPFSRENLEEILFRTGWEVQSESILDASGLADARWEIEACLADTGSQSALLGFDAKRAMFLESQLDVLKHLKEGASCLPIFALTASQSPR